MTDQQSDVWNQRLARQFAEVLSRISSVSEMQRVLRDVLTETEIEEASARLEAARMLATGARYSDVIEVTGLSSRTVARVSDWLTNGCGGYSIALEMIFDESAGSTRGKART